MSLLQQVNLPVKQLSLKAKAADQAGAGLIKAESFQVSRIGAGRLWTKYLEVRRQPRQPVDLNQWTSSQQWPQKPSQDTGMPVDRTKNIVCQEICTCVLL